MRTEGSDWNRGLVLLGRSDARGMRILLGACGALVAYGCLSQLDKMLVSETSGFIERLRLVRYFLR